MNQTEKIHGQIERITFQNEENGFTVAKMKVQGKKDLVTITGNLPGINAGETLELWGEWSHHLKFGNQFKIIRYKSIMPATITGIEKYLGSGLIRGIGPVMAGRLVRKFKEETLEVIENDPDRLNEVEGIGPKRVQMIKEAWDVQKEIREVMVFLQGPPPTIQSSPFPPSMISIPEVPKISSFRLPLLLQFPPLHSTISSRT